jgi:uncharacterized hydrophobic protein (TIGR00271 family)
MSNMGSTVARPRTSFQALFRPSDEIREEVSAGRQFDALYFSMLVFGCLIALLGLLLNSPAVIIGAMLISPLMGPILSCGLAMTLADGDLARKAGRNLGLSIAETIVIAALAAWLSPLKEITPEILARINPNLMDLLVAFFSGAAGTLALCSKRPGFTIVPGVAIATAVMPPLATVGYGISTRQWLVASGAFMLFFTNLASIVVSADIVFMMVGLRAAIAPTGQDKSWWIRHRMAISWVILVVLSIPLIRTLIIAADQRSVQTRIRSTLAQKLNHPGTSRVDEVTVQMGRDLVSTEVTVQTSKLILPEEQKQLEQELSQRLGRKVVLHLDQIQLAQAVNPASAVPVGRDYVGGGKIRPAAEEAKLSPAEMLQKIRESVGEELTPMLRAAGVEPFEIVSVGETGDGSLAIELRGRYQDKVADPGTWNVICAAIAEKSKLPVRLVATVYLPQSQVLWIPYRATATRPLSSELRTAQRTLAGWKKEGLEHEFLAPQDAEQKLFSQRIEYLESRLGKGLQVPQGVVLASDTEGRPANAVGMAAAQSIDVTSTGSTVTTPTAVATPTAVTTPATK